MSGIKKSNWLLVSGDWQLVQQMFNDCSNALRAFNGFKLVQQWFKGALKYESNKI
jgi:hypothetical protein